MNIEKLQQEVAVDLIIDQNNLDSCAAGVPILHSKYLRLLTECQLVCLKLKADRDRLYREKYLYYRNDYCVLLKNKAEIDVLLNGDSELQILELRYEYEKTCASYLESVLKQISGLSFLIRDSIEWKKFKAGI